MAWFGKPRQPLLAKPQGHLGICRCILVEHDQKIVIDVTAVHALDLEIRHNSTQVHPQWDNVQ
jgi:hypothetical protein